jgi:hypothetical protein
MRNSSKVGSIHTFSRNQTNVKPVLFSKLGRFFNLVLMFVIGLMQDFAYCDNTGSVEDIIRTNTGKRLNFRHAICNENKTTL